MTTPKTADVTVDEIRQIHGDILDIWTIAEMLKKHIDKAGDNPEAIVLFEALDNRLRRLSETTEPIINDIMREKIANKKVA